MSSGAHKKVLPFTPNGEKKGNPTPEKSTSRAEVDLLVKKARELVKGAPQKAAIILTDWLNKPRKLDNLRKKAG